MKATKKKKKSEAGKQPSNTHMHVAVLVPKHGNHRKNALIFFKRKKKREAAITNNLCFFLPPKKKKKER